MITEFLANVIGWYLIIFSWLILFRFNKLEVVISELLKSKALFFIVAVITFILGLLLVFSHNLWVMAWPVIITLFSWLVLISGILRLFFADSLMPIARNLLNHPLKLKIIAILLLALGLFLILKVHNAL